MVLPRINNPQVQSGKFSSFEFSSWMTSSPPEKPLAKVLLVWPLGTGCLRAVLPLSKLWRESPSALEKSLAGMWHLDEEPLLPKSLLTCRLPELALGHHPGPTRGLCIQITVSVSVLSLHPRVPEHRCSLGHLQHRCACCPEQLTCPQSPVAS